MLKNKEKLYKPFYYAIVYCEVKTDVYSPL